MDKEGPSLGRDLSWLWGSESEAELGLAGSAWGPLVLRAGGSVHGLLYTELRAASCLSVCHVNGWFFLGHLLVWEAILGQAKSWLIQLDSWSSGQPSSLSPVLNAQGAGGL